MTNKNQQFVDDIEFVFAEVVQLEREVISGNAAAVKDDLRMEKFSTKQLANSPRRLIERVDQSIPPSSAREA